MRSSIIFGSVTDAASECRALRPEQILSGTPTARGKAIGESTDGNLSCSLWECSAGRFEWRFASDEIIHVLEGNARITPRGGGETRTVGPGDVVFFPFGTLTEWEVETYIKKLAIHRSQSSIRALLKQKVRHALKKVSARI